MKTVIEVVLRDHISAGELRKLGFDLPGCIPDDWIVPRTALLPDPDSVEVRGEGDVLHCSVQVQLNARFRPPIRIEVDGPPLEALDLTIRDPRREP
jgi:hypothetical protein